jgi:hypothetical protein
MTTVDGEADLEHGGADLERVVEQLTARYPDRSRESIVEAVEQARLHFSGSKVQDFLPVLIERRVRASLREAPGR